VIPSWGEEGEGETVDEDAVEAEMEDLLTALDTWCEARNAADEWHSLVTFAGASMADYRTS
jgi:hypothetical protein